MTDRTITSGRKPVLITDTACDLSPAMLEELGVVCLPFPVIVDGVEYLDKTGEAMSNHRFYDLMRGGATTQTAAIPIPLLVETFERFAAEGVPVVHLGLSSALSGTFEGVHTARDRVLERYPEAVITIVDSLNASTSQGLLVHETARRIAEGADHDSVVAWLAEARTALSANFTVDSLEWLRRGGRISAAAAAAGTVLDVKPRLRIDRGGRLVVAQKLRGRRRSLTVLADLVAADIVDPAGQTIAIGHGSCEEDALRLREMIAERVEVGDVLMLEVGPVIGTHTGPGMVSVVFWGAQREA